MTTTTVSTNNLGNVLLNMGLVTMDKLKEAVLAQMETQGQERLGSVLLAMGVITEADLQVALKVQDLFRKGDVMEASMAIMRYQQARMDRSLDRQTLVVDKAMEAWENKTHA